MQKKDIEYEKQLSDVQLDRGKKVVIAGKEYNIKALKMYTRWLISECVNEMQIKEKDTINIIESMFTDIPLLVKIITYAILRDKDKVENEELFNKTYDALMEATDMQEYLNAWTAVVELLDVDWFFFIQEAVKGMNILPSKAGYREERKTKAQNQEYIMQPVNTEKSQE